MQDYSIDDLEAANPGSAFSAENGKVKTAITVLEKEAKEADNEWDQELLSATVEFLKTEVLQ